MGDLDGFMGIRVLDYVQTQIGYWHRARPGSWSHLQTAVVGVVLPEPPNDVATEFW